MKDYCLRLARSGAKTKLAVAIGAETSTAPSWCELGLFDSPLGAVERAVGWVGSLEHYEVGDTAVSVAQAGDRLSLCGDLSLVRIAQAHLAAFHRTSSLGIVIAGEARDLPGNDPVQLLHEITSTWSRLVDLDAEEHAVAEDCAVAQSYSEQPAVTVTVAISPEEGTEAYVRDFLEVVNENSLGLPSWSSELGCVVTLSPWTEKGHDITAIPLSDGERGEVLQHFRSAVSRPLQARKAEEYRAIIARLESDKGADLVANPLGTYEASVGAAEMRIRCAGWGFAGLSVVLLFPWNSPVSVHRQKANEWRRRASTALELHRCGETLKLLGENHRELAAFAADDLRALAASLVAFDTGERSRELSDETLLDALDRLHLGPAGLAQGRLSGRPLRDLRNARSWLPAGAAQAFLRCLFGIENCASVFHDATRLHGSSIRTRVATIRRALRAAAERYRDRVSAANTNVQKEASAEKAAELRRLTLDRIQRAVEEHSASIARLSEQQASGVESKRRRDVAKTLVTTPEAWSHHVAGGRSHQEALALLVGAPLRRLYRDCMRSFVDAVAKEEARTLQAMRSARGTSPPCPRETRDHEKMMPGFPYAEESRLGSMNYAGRASYVERLRERFSDDIESWFVSAVKGETEASTAHIGSEANRQCAVQVAEFPAPKQTYLEPAVELTRLTAIAQALNELCGELETLEVVP